MPTFWTVLLEAVKGAVAVDRATDPVALRRALNDYLWRTLSRQVYRPVDLGNCLDARDAKWLTDQVSLIESAARAPMWARPRRPRIHRPPGSILHRVSAFLFSKRTLERVLQPILTDLHDEYCEALAAGEVWKARWVRARGYFAFATAVVFKTAVGALARDFWTTVGPGGAAK